MPTDGRDEATPRIVVEVRAIQRVTDDMRWNMCAVHPLSMSARGAGDF